MTEARSGSDPGSGGSATYTNHTRREKQVRQGLNQEHIEHVQEGR